MKIIQTISLAMALSCSVATAAVDYPGTAPGTADINVTPGEQASQWKAKLSNKLLQAEFADGTFAGLKLADGKTVVAAGTPLFTLNLQNGKSLSSTDMVISDLKSIKLKANPNSPQLGKRFPGKAVTATFTSKDGSLEVKWRAILRDGSHYLRQEFTVLAKKDVPFLNLVPLQYKIVGGGEPTISGNTSHGRVVVNDLIFTGLETPMSIMSVGNEGATTAAVADPKSWTPESFEGTFSIPSSFEAKYGTEYDEKNGPFLKYLAVADNQVSFPEAGSCTLTFHYKSGNHRLNLLAVQLLNDSDAVVSEDVHRAAVGEKSTDNTFTLKIPKAGDYKLRYWAETKTESITSSGSVEFSMPLETKKKGVSEADDRLVRGTWERKTVLPAGKSWQVSSVIGISAPQQQRRSFLAYSERERASSYRPFIHYNDWYEIGIRLHDYKDPAQRTSEKMWLELLDTWYKELFVNRKTTIDAFVIDDGWDEFNSLWDFHIGFPNGFSKLDKSAKRMKAGIGTWLGPVGGYGFSKSQRLANWNNKHPNNQIGNFQLSNQEYFDAFVGRCKQMVRDYDMRYFKFDGISTLPYAKGPANLEDAEGIIRVLSELRKARPDIFINTTVGTWASPFWFHYADSIWRQQGDFDQIGTMGDDRDKWITYRDNLVHEVFVTGAPLFPINSIMTHGTIITKNGPPHVMSKDPANCIKEMRAAFGSGSALQELYVDQDLMNQENGRLWDELARCIKWIRRNADVLDDIHWVGGDPWDGSDGCVYGWAAWNPTKCTLTLRNSSDKEKSLTGTLRQILDIPPSVKGKILLRHSFEDQRAMPDLIGKPVDIDKELTITLQPMEVIVTEGIPGK